MNDKRTELIFILDRSGSMHGLEEDTIGGFNSMIEKQMKIEGEAFVTTILFDDNYEIVHDRLPLQNVPPMTQEVYTVRGSTALLDAIGKTIEHIAKIHKYAREEDVPKRTLFVITTDGHENASRIYPSDSVKKMIEYQKAEYQWEFLFLGANIDAVETAKHIGINADRAVSYHSDKVGTRLNYSAVGDAIVSYRKSEAVPPQNFVSMERSDRRRFQIKKETRQKRRQVRDKNRIKAYCNQYPFSVFYQKRGFVS